MVEGRRLTSRHRQDSHSRNKGHGTGVAMEGMASRTGGLHWPDTIVTSVQQDFLMAIVIQVVRSGPTYGMARGSMRQTSPQQAGTHLFEFYISVYYVLEQTQENYGGQGQPVSMLESYFPRVLAR